jgi:hypothetical protein
MRRVKLAVLAAGVLAVLASPGAEACGDKLLSIARGIRLQQAYKARHPATIVMYVSDTTSSGTTQQQRALVQMSLLYMSLRQAGHRISVAGSPSELADALRGPVDFLITDIGDAGVVREGVGAGHLGGSLIPVSTGTQTSTVIPVLFKPSKADLAAAQKKYGLVLKTPAGAAEQLEVIDRAMKARSERAAPGI